MFNPTRPVIFLIIIVLALMCYFVPFKPLSILSALLLALIAIWIIVERKNPGFTNKLFKSFGKTTLKLNGKNFELSAPTADVEIKVTSSSPYALLDNEEIPLIEDIEIERDSKNIKKITIFLNENIDNIKVSLITGDLSISDVNAIKLEAQDVSGDVKLYNVRATDVNAKSVSGDVEVNRSKANKIVSASTSGDCKVSNSTALNIKSSTISGDIEVVAAFISCELSSTSGDIDIITKDRGYSVSIGTTSGSWTFFERSGKGNYEEKGSEEYLIKANTLSGSVKIIKG